MRPRIAVAVAAAGLVLAAPSAAAWAAGATDPLDMAGAYVLDHSGVLDGREAEIEEALDELYDRAEVGLFVVVVDSFTGAGDCIDWANTTAEASGLGSDDVLLAIASRDRDYCYSVASDFELSNSELDDVAEGGFLSELGSDDYVDGIVEYAEDLGDALQDGGSTVVDPPGSDGGSDGGLGWLPWVAGAGVVGVGVWGISRAVRRRKGGGGSAAGGAAGQPTQEELDRQAGGVLIALDDAVRESEQELGFAEAQFGAARVSAFTTALAEAKGRLQQAFAIRQQLDDSQPETAEEKYRLTAELIRLCEEADAALDAQADEFEQLRGLEKSAPEVLAAVKASRDALEPRAAAAAAAVSGLASKFGAAAVEAVAENPEQARHLIGFAAEAIATADTALAESRSSDAAVAVRDAQQAVGQATGLLDAVDALGVELPKLVERVAAARAALTTAVAEAQTAATAAGADTAALSAAAGEAERALAASQAADPASALTALETATTSLDAALSTARDHQARLAAATQQYERLRATAEQRILQAQNYIATRRGGVGYSARTRIAEAERLLADAAGLAVSDPAAAAQAAQRAAAHADSALQLARSDVASFDRGASTGGGPDLGSVILGGLLSGRSSGSYSGGYSTSGGLGGGFGGSSRRSPGGLSSIRGSRPSASGSGSRRSSSRSGSSRSSGGRRGGGRF